MVAYDSEVESSFNPVVMDILLLKNDYTVMHTIVPFSFYLISWTDVLVW